MLNPADDPKSTTPTNSNEQASKPTNSKWLPYIKIVAYLLAVGIIPLVTHLITSSMERYRIKSEKLTKTAKQENDRIANQRQIQLAILKQVLDISSQANVNDQAHVIRLGLIATIVEDNVDVFGFKMVTALKRLDSLTTILRPIGILRNKLADSNKEIVDIGLKLKRNQQRESRLAADLTALDRRLKASAHRTDVERLKLESEVALKREELEKARVDHELDQKKLQRELASKGEYLAELERANRDLQVRVEAVRKAKDEVEADAVKLKGLVADLSSQSHATKKQMTDLNFAVERLTKANATATATIQHLKAMLDSVVEENRKLKVDLDAAKKPAVPPTK